MALYTQSTIATQKDSPALVSELALSNGACCMTNPTFGIDTNFDIKNTVAFDMVVGGVFVTIAADTNWDTGAVKAIDADAWAAALLSIDADGTTYLQWTADAVSEAAAILLLDDLTPTGAVVCGYAGVTTASAQTLTAGTDALQGGTGGNPSADTNYYNVMGWVQ